MFLHHFDVDRNWLPFLAGRFSLGSAPGCEFGARPGRRPHSDRRRTRQRLRRSVLDETGEYDTRLLAWLSLSAFRR